MLFRGLASKLPRQEAKYMPTLVLEKLKTAIWNKRPILGEIMRKHGGKHLYDYTKDFLDVNPSPLLDARKPELIEITRKLLEERLGPDTAAKVAKELQKLPLVSTTDHHGPIQHPFFLNSNIISAIPYLEKQDADLNYLVVFSFASVSVNNASTYTRGVLFHDDNDELTRLPILPDKFKMGVVYATRGYTREDLDRAYAELDKKGGERSMKMKELIEKYFGNPEVLKTPDLNSQITKINRALWRGCFPRGDKKIPDLIYLEIETLVTELLIQNHLKNPDSLIYKFLFDPEYIELNYKHFNNIPGAFSLEKGWGTYMFWALDEKLHRVRLNLVDGKLTSGHGSWTYDFTPEGIAQALRAKKIFPSMLICYLVVALYYGMKCLGGFCQVNDLTKTKEAWANMLRELGNNEEADALAPVQTKELGGDGMVLAYHKMKNGESTPATSFDIILNPRDADCRNYIAHSKKVTLMEMMEPMLPEMYGVLYPIHERDPILQREA